MKNKIKFIVLSIFLISGINSIAQEKIAVLNINNIILLLPETKALNKKVEEIKKEYKSKVETMYADFSKKSEKYSKESNQVTDEKNTERQKELSELEQKIKNYMLDVEQNINTLNSNLLSSTYVKVKTASEKVAKVNGYDFVIHIENQKSLIVGNSEELVNINSSFEQKIKKELGL